jgi:phosphoglycerate kinase
MTLPFKTIEELPIDGKRVLLRVDFNVPLTPEGNVADDTRIQMSLPTIRYALEHRSRVILMSHLGRPKGVVKPELSLRPIAERLSTILGEPVPLAPDCIGPEVEKSVSSLGEGEILLLENLRFHPEETKNDPGFARSIARLGEAYISDAFGAVHRAHASVAGVPEHMDIKGGGFLLKKEVEALSRILTAQTSKFVLILGGAKVSDKLEILLSLIDRAHVILIGGAMAYTFLKIQGVDMGNSLVEEDSFQEAEAILKKAEEMKTAFHLPVDHVVATEIHKTASYQTTEDATIPPSFMGVDIGPKTIKTYADQLSDATMIFWNGPMGVFEIPAFARGTFDIAKAVATSPGESYVGGGDSIRAIQESGVANQITHISSGGGASLEFLEGKPLPGIEALKTD